MQVSRIIAVFALTTLVFLSGFVFSDWLMGRKTTQLERMLEEASLNSESILVEQQLALESSCELRTFNFLTNNLDTLAEKISSLPKDDYQSNFLKKKYTLEELKHWQFVRQLNTKCNTSYQTILYFYSKDCPYCDAEGVVLSTVKGKLDKQGKKVMIYSFDADLDFSPIYLLKIRYAINTTPALVVNDLPYLGFVSEDELYNLLSQNLTNQSVK